MTNVLRLAALAVAMASVMTAPAFAGGGSSKDDPTLTLRNDLGEEVYIHIVQTGDEGDFQEAVIDRLESGASTSFGDAFTDLGGKVVTANARARYDVDDDEGYTVLVASTLDVDAVDLTDPDAADQIAALFAAGEVEIDQDTTLRLSDILF